VLQGGPLSPLLANIVLDPLDKELERRGHKFARYADDFIVMVKSARAAERVKTSLIRFAEDRLKLVINRAKSKAAPLRSCAFLGFQIGARGRVVWTDKAYLRFKQRVREITRRNRGHRVQQVIDELRLYVTGWFNYFGISHSYKAVLELADWVRRRVRLYYWKQWKQPRTRRRHLLLLGTDPEEVKMAGDPQPQRLLADEWQPHCATSAEQPMAGRTRSSQSTHVMDCASLRAKSPSLIGTAGRGPACPVVWDPGANYSRGPD
jgi:RNA-directed DNA polymerase